METIIPIDRISASTHDVVVSDRMGVYIPKIFIESNEDIAKAFPFDSWVVGLGPYVDENTPDEDLVYHDQDKDEQRQFSSQEIQDMYWDCWQKIIDSAVWQDVDGEKWRLHQDGDLFVYRDSMSEIQWNEVFGNC